MIGAFQVAVLALLGCDRLRPGASGGDDAGLPRAAGASEAALRPESGRRGPPDGGSDGRGFRLREIRDAEERLAVCNNGEPATFFVEPGVGADKHKWIVYLKGGGRCKSIDECKAREKSTPFWMVPTGERRAPEEKGILSDDERENPHFHGWSKAFVPYCSSDYWSGDAAASEATGGYHFRGSRIVEAVFEDMLAYEGPGGLSEATELILAGGSAGGVGVQYNLDRVAARLPGKRVVGLSDSAAGADFLVEREPSPEEIEEAKRRAVEKDTPRLADTFWKPRVDESCVAEVGPLERLCLSILRGRFVSTPMFLFEDLRDAHSLKTQHIARGSVEEQAYMTSIREMLARFEGGAFATHAGFHTAAYTERFTEAKVRHTDRNGYTYSDVFANWYFQTGGPTKVIAD